MAVRIQYFFDNPHTFPWDFMGLTKPQYGPVHAYLCKFLVDFERQSAAYFLGSPTFGELQKYADVNKGLARAICDYCKPLYEKSKSERDSTSLEVLRFLERYYPFNQYMKNKIEDAYQRGYISIPAQCRPL
jgi:hypothetical protein